jgi:cyanophycinase
MNPMQNATPANESSRVSSNPRPAMSVTGSPHRPPILVRAALWMLALTQVVLPVAQARESVAAAPAKPVVATTPGPAIAIGGALRDDNAVVWSRMIELAGGPGARFVVLATASGDPEALASTCPSRRS